MYDKQVINHLTELYLNGKKDVIDDLLKALIPMIDIVLKKGYSSRSSDWEDLKQGCLLELFEILKRKPMGLRIALAKRNRKDKDKAKKALQPKTQRDPLFYSAVTDKNKS